MVGSCGQGRDPWSPERCCTGALTHSVCAWQESAANPVSLESPEKRVFKLHLLGFWPRFVFPSECIVSAPGVSEGFAGQGAFVVFLLF